MVGIALSLISLNFYFVQELLSAELFFVIAFGILFVLIGACYLLGLSMQRGWALMKHDAHGHTIRPHKASPARSLQPNVGA